jgi:hypothetical protein
MYRTIDCATWDDPWFAELDPQAKLLFLYFLTNRRSTAAGCFEITMRAIAFETGMAVSDVQWHLEALKGRIEWFPEHQVIFVRNFYRHQCANSNRANFQSSALKVLVEMPAEVRASVAHVYPELQVPEATHPQPIPNPSPTLGDKEEVEVEEEVEVTETVEGEGARANARTRAVPIRNSSGFDRFYDRYPRKTGRKDAESAWKRINPSEELAAEIIGAVERQKGWEQWQSGVIPHPATFLNRERWKDEEPPRKQHHANGRASPEMTNAELSVAAIRRAAGKQGPEPSGPVYETTGRIQR